jgi:hypothetical protein
MPVSLMTTHKKIQSHHGFFHAHVTHKDATIMPVLNPTSFASKDFRTKPLLQTTSTPISQFNILNFKYGNDRFSQEAIDTKIEKYQSLINDIKALGWNVDPLIVIVVGARATTFKPSMTSLEDNFNISLEQIKKTFTAINTIAIQYAMKILLIECKLENNQTLPYFRDNT